MLAWSFRSSLDFSDRNKGGNSSKIPDKESLNQELSVSITCDDAAAAPAAIPAQDRYRQTSEKSIMMILSTLGVSLFHSQRHGPFRG